MDSLATGDVNICPVSDTFSVTTRLVARLINAYWQYCQYGDTNVDSSETSGIMKLSPD